MTVNETEIIVIMVSYILNVFKQRRHNIMNYYKWCLKLFFNKMT